MSKKKAGRWQFRHRLPCCALHTLQRPSHSLQRGCCCCCSLDWALINVIFNPILVQSFDLSTVQMHTILVWSYRLGSHDPCLSPNHKGHSKHRTSQYLRHQAHMFSRIFHIYLCCLLNCSSNWEPCSDPTRVGVFPGSVFWDGRLKTPASLKLNVARPLFPVERGSALSQEAILAIRLCSRRFDPEDPYISF